MVDLRKKLLGLSGAAMLFTGLAYGQTTCSTLTPVGGATFIRAEGQTELLPQLALACTAGAAASTVNVTVYLSPAVTITSKLLNSGNGQVEATANGVLGVVTGSSITFTGIPIGAAPAGANILISNIRVNATSIPSAIGAPPTSITAQAFVGGTNVTGNVVGTTVPVAFALNGLGKVFVSKDLAGASPGITTASLGVCSSISAQSSTPTATPQFFVQIAEGFQNAFRNASDEASQVSVTSGATGISNAVNSGTRVRLVFGNIPAGGLQIYVPSVVTAPDGANLVLTSSETGALSPIPGITGQSNISTLTGTGAVALLTTTGTTATAIYEVAATPGTAAAPGVGDNLGVIDNFSFPVYAIAGSNSLTAQAAAMTLTVSLAPVTAATTIPSFAVGSSTAAINTLSFVVCQTSLLFPFVTNQAGFETGIAISNTSKDPFTSNSAKPQSGTCMLNYYGTSGTNPTATTAPNTNETTGAPYLAGESYAFTLTNALAAGTGNPATFQGYIIAQCQFQNAHGFAYIVYNFPGTSSDTMGYLALVLNGRGSTSAEVTYQ